MTTVNSIIEPFVRAGCGWLPLAPAGLIVLETTGRRTGRPHRVPLLAGILEGHIWVTTTRGGRSDWVRNAAHSHEVCYWLHSRVHQAKAVVFAPGRRPPNRVLLPQNTRDAADRLARAAAPLGIAFAVLEPGRR